MKIFKKTGFTLIELMIVMAIMGILSAILAPNLQHYMGERRLNGAARMVMSDLMLARQKAVSQNNRFRVLFTSNHTYTIHDDDNNNNAIDSGEITENRDIHTDYYDVTFTSSGNPIFNPRGTALVGTNVLLTSAKTGGTLYVKVATTGRVKIDTAP